VSYFERLLEPSPPRRRPSRYAVICRFVSIVFAIGEGVLLSSAAADP
jgi:hypothetical protein